ncbi:MAG: hypothetical protein ABFR53_06890 [Actinomycetota bacterium]
MKRIAIAFVALALILAACQSVTENIAENLTEQVLESEGLENVEIDTDSGEVSIETDEGSVTIGGGEIPDGFPIPVPDGYQVTSVFTAEGTSSVSLAYGNGDFGAIEAFYEDWTGSQASEWRKTTSSVSNEDGTFDSTNWVEEEGDSFISVSNLCIVLDDSIDPDNCVAVNINTSSG